MAAEPQPASFSELLAWLDWHPIGEGHERAVTEVRGGESIPDPSSTRRRIHGPATVEFTQWADGGIDARIL